MMVGMELAALPMPLTWDEPPESTENDGAARLTVVAGARTDMFHNPDDGVRTLNAPRALGTPPAGDFQLSARVSVEFGQTYDAGALLVWAGGSHWAKLCFERSPQGETMPVSVVTRGLSDDANGAAAPAGQPIWLRVSRLGPAWAFHASLDGLMWSFVRHFSLDAPSTVVTVGFVAQSPLGDGCRVTFDDIAFTTDTLADLRSGV
jgi:regulation of enolase protein 1 (concanavalin A-like superfamily)